MKRRIWYIQCLLLLLFGWMYGSDSFVTNGRSISAYDTEGAYMVTDDNELMRWESSIKKWELIDPFAPLMRQIDCLTDGTSLLGTDDVDHARLWNSLPWPASTWSSPRGSKEYDWVVIDHIDERRRGLVKGLVKAWESWNGGAPSSWYDHLPTGTIGSQKMNNYWFVDKNVERFKRWERGDQNYYVALNQSGQGTPFNVYCFSDDKEQVIDRITDPPLLTHNIDDVMCRQISYDELQQNLWCIDKDGKPWQWDNVEQEWILRDRRKEGESTEEDDREQDWTPVINLLKEQSEFYIRTMYIDGEYTPYIIIFKDSRVIHFILGENSTASMEDIDIFILEPKQRDHKFHTVLLRPHETPQKIVRVNGGKRIRENHLLERLFIQHNIIARHEDIGVYPAWHHRVRR